MPPPVGVVSTSPAERMSPVELSPSSTNFERTVRSPTTWLLNPPGPYCWITGSRIPIDASPSRNVLSNPTISRLTFDPPTPGLSDAPSRS